MTQEVYQILQSRGYPLTCRGPIEVKGKGNMVTYFLDGYANKPPTNIFINPLGNGTVQDLGPGNTPEDKVPNSSQPTLETINEKN